MYGSLIVVGLALLSADPETVRAALRLDVPVRQAQAESLEALYSKMQRAMEENRPEEALTWAKAMSAHPDYARRPEEAQRALDFLIGLIQLELERPALALDSLVRATDWERAPADYWLARLDAQVAVGDQNAAARTMAELSRRHPAAVQALPGVGVMQLAGSPQLDPDAGFALREALFASGWRHEDDSWIWLKLVDDLISRDRAAEAAPLVERVTDPGSRLQLFSLRRYDVVRPADATFDPAVALQAGLALDRKRAEAEGATLEQRHRHVEALLGLGRLEEGLAAADAILAEPEPDAEADPEGASSRTWTMDSRARILLLLGRADEALEQQRAAAARQEYGQPNVSQAINLGWLALRAGRPDQARAAAAAVPEDDVSPFGRMQLLQVRACAAHELGDSAAFTTDLESMRSGWRDAPTALYGLYACQGDEEAMARTLIDMLGDSDHAETGVALLHDYTGQGDVTDFDRRLAALHQRVAARPEVIAARDRVGRAFAVPTIGLHF